MTDHLAKAYELKERAEKLIKQDNLMGALWILRDAADHALIAHDMIDVNLALPEFGQKVLAWVTGEFAEFMVLEYVDDEFWSDSETLTEFVTLWQALPLAHTVIKEGQT